MSERLKRRARARAPRVSARETDRVRVTSVRAQATPLRVRARRIERGRTKMASSSRDSEPGKTMSSHHHKYSSRIVSKTPVAAAFPWREGGVRLVELPRACTNYSRRNFKTEFFFAASTMRLLLLFMYIPSSWLNVSKKPFHNNILCSPFSISFSRDDVGNNIFCTVVEPGPYSTFIRTLLRNNYVMLMMSSK